MNYRQAKENKLNRLRGPIIIFIAFWATAIVLWQTKGNVFYLFNFGYIGTAVGVGVGLYIMLPRKKKPFGRRFAQLLVGIYMLGFLGLLKKENMQLEGFFFYLLTGVFAGSVIHYIVAKVFGPVLFGRGFCGWACWTAMVLDFLPHKLNPNGRHAARWEKVRYLHFVVSLCLILILWFLFRYRLALIDHSGLLWLVVGNVFYFASAILLAFILRDNRAFCKYLCPITAILKTTSRFALLKIEGDREKCTQCGTCVKACPMNINIMEYINNGQRVLSTECIFCLMCTTVCPAGVLSGTFKMDIGGKEILQRR